MRATDKTQYVSAWESHLNEMNSMINDLTFERLGNPEAMAQWEKFKAAKEVIIGLIDKAGEAVFPTPEAPKEMTYRQFTAWLKKNHNNRVTYLSSHGLDRDHRVWHCEWDDGTSEQINITASGKFDGKPYCESRARRDAYEKKAAEYGIEIIW